MDVSQTLFCTMMDRQNQSRFLCCTRRKNGIFNICLTDAANVWSTDYSEDMLEQSRQMFALKSTEEFIVKVRSACVKRGMSVVVHDNSVELIGGSSTGDLRVKLPRLEAPQALEELKVLLFTMADNLAQPDTECVSPSVSPMKNHQRWPAEFEPRQQQNSAPLLKKRLAGTSLINPGTKKKVRATGVAFDDADED